MKAEMEIDIVYSPLMYKYNFIDFHFKKKKKEKPLQKSVNLEKPET